jgi:hypothetical protein
MLAYGAAASLHRSGFPPAFLADLALAARAHPSQADSPRVQTDLPGRQLAMFRMLAPLVFPRLFERWHRENPAVDDTRDG